MLVAWSLLKTLIREVGDTCILSVVTFCVFTLSFSSGSVDASLMLDVNRTRALVNDETGSGRP